VPSDVLVLRDKEQLKPEDYVTLADECLSCGEEQLAARLYVAACCTAGEREKHGEALVKLADLYMNSDWPKNGGREWDVMKAVDLLTEALSLGCVSNARDALEGMREQLFEEYEDEPDVDYFIRNYQPDALCLAALCLGVGIGWKKDIASSKRLYEAALAQGYPRASYYLKEIQSGRVK
jgi:TPR repeat protein